MSVLIVVTGFVPSRVARALDAFEIQVYDGTANAAGAPGLELHINDVMRRPTTAMPRARTQPSTGSFHTGAFMRRHGLLGARCLPPDGAADDGTFDFAGVKARSKLVTRPSWSTTRRLGLNVEVSDIPARYEAERWGLELRPIVAQDLGQFSVVVNPIVSVSLTGSAACSNRPPRSSSRGRDSRRWASSTTPISGTLRASLAFAIRSTTFSRWRTC